MYAVRAPHLPVGLRFELHRCDAGRRWVTRRWVQPGFPVTWNAAGMWRWSPLAGRAEGADRRRYLESGATVSGIPWGYGIRLNQMPGSGHCSRLGLILCAGVGAAASRLWPNDLPGQAELSGSRLRATKPAARVLVEIDIGALTPEQRRATVQASVALSRLRAGNETLAARIRCLEHPVPELRCVGYDNGSES